MPPLITREEALRLGEIEDHAEIEALVDRAWAARTEQFGDSTDMCSLVNAKSGGCAEDCGFCAQSKFADAETPMHAMMEPEQLLEHARAAEAAGAHRFCLVTQGQGLSKRTSTRCSRACASSPSTRASSAARRSGTSSPARAKSLAEAGVQRVHRRLGVRELRLGAEPAVLGAAAGLRVDERAHVRRVPNCVRAARACPRAPRSRRGLRSPEAQSFLAL